VVFLAGCEKGLLPLRFGGSGPGTPAEEAAERRLLFVGMTRGRRRLLLSWAARRTRYGAQAPTGRSPFLAAIDTEAARGPAPKRPAKPRTRQLRLL
jgi:DNA helicase-2/ATP-dependent DNA helicase PcrA